MEKLKFDLIESLHSKQLITLCINRREFLMELCNLLGQYLDFICDQIFAYLDYDSLTNSKMVSVVWKRIVSKGEFWKVMVERKVKCFLFILA